MLKLVYGCLAFTAVSLITFIALASSQGQFRGFNDPTAFALMDGAEVLTADRNGAITQTGDGKVYGYALGERRWKDSFDRFTKRTSTSRAFQVPNASADCVGACPSALVSLPSGITAEGDADPGGALTRSLNRRKAHVFVTVAPNAAFATAGTTDQFAWFLGEGVQNIDIDRVGSVALNADQDLAVVGSVDGSRGWLHTLERGSGLWRPFGEPVRQDNLRNACIDEDGTRIASAGDQFEIRRFGAAEGTPIGPRIASGNCSIDDRGTTLVYSTPAAPTIVIAARYGFEGGRQWVRKLGPNTLLSRSGATTIVVRGGAHGTTVGIDARTGRETFRADIESRPFVANDGSIVSANRHGEPIWHVIGGG